MRADLLRVLAVVLACLIPGLWLDHPFMIVSFGLVGLGAWYFRALEGVLASARSEEAIELPDVPGLVNDIALEFSLARSYHQQWERRLSDYLVQFREAASALPDAIVLTDQDGRIKWANERARAYLGIDFPRDAGQTMANLVRHPDFTRALEGSAPSGWRQVVEIPSPLREEMQVELRISRYSDADTLFVARDVTEAQRLGRMRRDFIANASHELRTPLTVIYGYLEALEEDIDRCPPEWKSRLLQMRSQAQRMQRLIEDLLTLSALENAADESPGEEVPVGELVLSMQKEAQVLSGTARHVITADVDSALWLRGSQRDLYSIISNVVSNAVHHTPAAGAIHLRWYADGQGAHFEVVDQGMGIAPEHIARLTERFYRVDKGRSRAYGGTGLGLAIVKHALARHDASLEIRSTLGKGSVFLCHFPPDRVLRQPDAPRAGSQRAR